MTGKNILFWCFSPAVPEELNVYIYRTTFSFQGAMSNGRLLLTPDCRYMQNMFCAHAASMKPVGLGLGSINLPSRRHVTGF